MRRILVIGIGAGDPEYVTVQAVRAMNAVDVFFVIDKGLDKVDLTQLRTEICERYIEHRRYRIVEIPDPERDRAAPAYRAAVHQWRNQRAERLEKAIDEELAEDGCGALLVWGDPSLYDSTLAVVEQIAAHGRVAFEYEVIPGITSVQALAARHRIPLNRIGGEVRITTGRRLRGLLANQGEGFADQGEGLAERSTGLAERDEGLAGLGDDVVVMLDAECSFKTLADQDIDIYWGAYVGTPEEILIAGRLKEVAERIERARLDARARTGWIMDTYLLRRRERGER
jgi:precorrin-6A synthase